MNIGRVPTGPLNQLLARRSSAYTIYKEESDTDGWNEDTPTLVSTNETVQIDVHNQQTSPQQYPTGEEYETSLQALVATRANTAALENDRCIVHGGTVYQMTIDGWPDAQDPSVYVLTLEERTDIKTP